MIQRLECLHQKEIVHRDIKPENFLIGASKKVNIIYCIDFGLSKRFINPTSGEHVEYKKKTSWVTGTPRYCSSNAFKGKAQSRRDDFESVANILVYFSRNGWLPWMRGEDDLMLKNDPFTFNQLRKFTAAEEITKDCPAHIIEFFNYTKSLKFEQKPDYKYCIGILQKYLVDNKFDMKEEGWDWDLHR